MEMSHFMRQELRTGHYDALQGNAFTFQQVNKAAVESGQAMGFNLHVEADPQAELMDSMEELSFQFEEKEMKGIGERKLGDAHKTRSPYFVAIQGWQKVLPDMPGGAFMERMLQMLRQADMRQLSPQWLLGKLGEGSRDPSHQFAMLECLEEALKDDESQTMLRELVGNAKHLLESERGAEVRAGLNLAEQINGMAKTPEEMQDLRQLYRGEVLGFKSPQDCFRSLLQERGAGRLEEAIDFLVKGCGIDLQSPSPSQSKEELQRILSDLQCVNVLRTVLESNTVLAGKMLSQFGETCLLNGEKMTGKIMEFTEMQFVTSETIASYISSCGITQLLAQLYFCTELLTMLHRLSPRLFSDEADRFKLIDAGQEHLDGLVRKQEDAEEQQEKEARK